MLDPLSFIENIDPANTGLTTKHIKDLVKYNLLLVARMLSNPEKIPYFNSRKMDKFCERIIGILNDPSFCQNLFDGASDL